MFLGSTPLKQSQEILIGYKSHLFQGQARRDGKSKPLSLNTISKNLDTVREFLNWLREEKGYKFRASWIDYHFKLTRSERNNLNVSKSNKGTPYYTVEEVSAIAKTPVSTLLEERTRMSCVFLWLTGMRIGAFVTLPRLAVNLEEHTVHQNPLHGTHTKLGKSAITSILDVPDHPELFELLRAWEEKIRDVVPPTGMWYANISPLTGKLEPSVHVGKNRDSGFRKDLAAFLEKVGIGYKNPHMFRHGHIHFLRSRARNVGEIAAIAKNTMQTIPTMLSYAELGQEDANSIVRSLSSRSFTSQSSQPVATLDKDTLTSILQEVLDFYLTAERPPKIGRLHDTT